eukprot:3144_1
MSSGTTDNIIQETQIKDITDKDNQQKHENIDKQIDNNNEIKELDNLTAAVDDEEEKFDPNRAPSIMKQLTNINDHANRIKRWNTPLVLIEIDDHEIEDITVKDSQQKHENIDKQIDNNNETKESDNLT